MQLIGMLDSPYVRRTAISLLSRSKNPRAIALLQELIDK